MLSSPISHNSHGLHSLSCSHSLDVNKDGVAAYAGHQSVTVACTKQQHILRCLGPHRARVCSVAFAPAAAGSKLVVGCEDGTARCWDWLTGAGVAAAKANSTVKGKASRKADAAGTELSAVVLPPWIDAPTAVFGDGSGQLLRWQFSSSAKLTRITRLNSKVFSLTAAAAAGAAAQLQQVVAGCADGCCVLVDISSSTQLAVWTAHQAPVHTVIWLNAPKQRAGDCRAVQQAVQQAVLQQTEQTAADDAAGGCTQPHALQGVQAVDAAAAHEQQAVCQGAADVAEHGASARSCSSSCCRAAVAAHQMDYVITAGADKCVKLWRIEQPCVSEAVQQQQQQQQAEGSGTVAAAAAIVQQHHVGEPAVTTQQPLQADITSTAAAAAAAAMEAGFEVQPVETSPSSTPPPAAAAAAAQVFNPVPATVELLAAAQVRQPGSNSKSSGTSSRQQQGRHTQVHHAAAAVVPGSEGCDGSCLLLLGGSAGSLLMTTLVPGNMSCQSSFLKQPHNRTIYQLLLLPAQQQQQQPLPLGCFNLYSISMDRSLVVSELTIQHKTPAAAAAAAAVPCEVVSQDGSSSPAAAAGTTLGGSSSSSSKDTQCDSAVIALTEPPVSPAAAAAVDPASQGQCTKTDSSSSTLGSSGAVSVPGWAAAAGYTASGCRVVWCCQGLGGYGYAVAAQQAAADAVRQYPQYSTVRLAVGCGDKTIRVLTVVVRCQPGSTGGTAAAAAGEEDSNGALPADSSSADYASSSSAAAAAVISAQTSCVHSELQSPLLTHQLLWRHLQDQVLAVAWHPTNTRQLAFGCADGVVGVFDTQDSSTRQCFTYSRRHSGPVTQLAWLQQWQTCSSSSSSSGTLPPQQQCAAAAVPVGAAVLYSLGGEGCLLAWPSNKNNTLSSVTHAAAAPVDVGAQLQQLWLQNQSPAAAAPAAAAAAAVIWSCFSCHSSGTLLVSSSSRGHIVLVRRGDANTGNSPIPKPSAAAAAAAAVVSCTQESDSSSWRTAPQQQQQQTGGSSSSSSDSSSPWQLIGSLATGAGLPLIAAAWQPAAAAAAVCPTLGRHHAAEGEPLLLAMIDRQSVYLVACNPQGQLQQQQAGSLQPGNDTTAAAALHCCWRLAAGQGSSSSSNDQLRLSAVCWSDMSTVCVGDSLGSCQVLRICSSSSSNMCLVPVHRLAGHMGGISSLSGFPGWPGLAVSTSFDQTVRCWQPGKNVAAAESPQSPAAASVAAAASPASAAAAAATNGSSSSQGSIQQDASKIAEIVTVQAAAAACSDATTVVTPALPLTAPAAAVLPAKSGPAATSSSSSSTPLSMRHWKQFVLPGSRSFLPSLPDLEQPALQLQAQLDVVALAEALYPPTTAAAAAALHSSDVTAAGAAACGSSGAIREESRSILSRLLKPNVEVAAQQQQQPSEDHSSSSSRSSNNNNSISGAMHICLSNAVGRDHSVGSWLPNMTADVPELLLQYQQQQQGDTPQPSSGSCCSSNAVANKPLAVNQAAMMQFITGDVGGFLRAAVIADVITPDVVALAAAGGEAAYAAAARLAAAKHAAGGQAAAAAVQLLAVGDAADAASLMRHVQGSSDTDRVLQH